MRADESHPVQTCSGLRPAAFGESDRSDLSDRSDWSDFAGAEGVAAARGAVAGTGGRRDVLRTA